MEWDATGGLGVLVDKGELDNALAVYLVLDVCGVLDRAIDRVGEFAPAECGEAGEEEGGLARRCVRCMIVGYPSRIREQFFHVQKLYSRLKTLLQASVDVSQ